MRIAARWDKQVEYYSCPEKWIPYDTLDIHKHAHHDDDYDHEAVLVHMFLS